MNNFTILKLTYIKKVFYLIPFRYQYDSFEKFLKKVVARYGLLRNPTCSARLFNLYIINQFALIKIYNKIVGFVITDIKTNIGKLFFIIN